MTKALRGATYPDLEGRNVLVTGGGSGIGAAIVRAFARQRAPVGFVDVKRAESEALVAEIRAGGSKVAFAEADVTELIATRTTPPAPPT